MSRADEQLMSQLIAKVRENLSDANYNVEALAAAMNMSRSSLHRKRIFRLYLILLTVSLGYI